MTSSSSPKIQEFVFLFSQAPATVPVWLTDGLDTHSIIFSIIQAMSPLPPLNTSFIRLENYDFDVLGITRPSGGVQARYYNRHIQPLPTGKFQGSFQILTIRELIPPLQLPSTNA
jgi:hypothetical protein